jgi:adenylate kinase family enzyme
MQTFSITLIGPGGAGKSTIAPLLAERLRIRAVDLDRLFTEHAGSISEYINRFSSTARRWRGCVQNSASLARRATRSSSDISGVASAA